MDLSALPHVLSTAATSRSFTGPAFGAALASPADVGHDGQVDTSRARLLLDALTPGGQLDTVKDFARSLHRSATAANNLLVVGTPGYEPWHFTAHLSDEARYTGLPALEPTLVRWKVPVNAPDHLSVALNRLETTGRGEALLVVTEETAPERLLERVWDARKAGTTILTIDAGDKELSGIAHEALVVPPIPVADASFPAVPDVLDFDMTQHLVSIAVGEQPASRARRVKHRLAKFLDKVSGPSANSESW